ncbi:hypothetical protein RN053_20925 [Pantoea dispersa]|uniref:hypothetical protein n=1 Tax=Pantoea dispersa TaxID=59814 RepID=UPI0028E005FD|nr:hypothetical protein [Pantoea dispersa]MDT8852976.1 hypothetical protein [Pantoea dispersa]
MKPQTPQEKFDATFVELKKKHLPSFRKVSVMFLMILVLSWIVSWFWEYIHPAEIPATTENHDVFQKLSTFSNFIMVFAILMLLYTGYLVTGIIRFKRKSSNALMIMSAEMVENSSKSQNNKTRS